jgi:hypothetical protein
MVDVHCEIIKDEEPKSPTKGKLVFSVSKNRFGYSGKGYIVELGQKGLSVVGDADLPVNDDDEEDEPSERPAPKSSGVMPKVVVPDVPGGTRVTAQKK